MMHCPLCQHASCAPFAKIAERRYFRCPACLLTFLDPAQRLDPAAERTHYDLHDNNPDDPHYRAFLDRLAQPLIKRLTPGSQGLDFGCGPGPALAIMLRERGFEMEVYDPIYAPNERVLSRQYDFVTCTEVAEHLYQPDKVFALLATLVRPNGWLGVMTGLLTEEIDFSRWHYHRDPTHVCFYHPDTFASAPVSTHWQRRTICNNSVLLQRR